MIGLERLLDMQYVSQNLLRQASCLPQFLKWHILKHPSTQMGARRQDALRALLEVDRQDGKSARGETRCGGLPRGIFGRGQSGLLNRNRNSHIQAQCGPKPFLSLGFGGAPDRNRICADAN